MPKTKYRVERETINAFVEQVKIHNETISFINEAVASWDFQSLLTNPHSLSKEHLVKFTKAAELLKNYTVLDNRIFSFQKESTQFIDDREEIFLEFDSIDEYNKLFDFNDFGYINCNQKREIITKIHQILSKFGKKDNYYYPFDKHLQIDSLVEEHNTLYLNSILDKKIFDDINGRSLDEEQRKAILIDEKSVLVVAGAGSGKTLTICGKVAYLLKEKNVNPNKILLLSYSRNSAEDLLSKVSKINSQLTVGTFHKTGLNILKKANKKTYMVEDQYQAIIESFFRDEMKRRPSTLQKIFTYYGLYLSSIDYEKKYKSEGYLYEDLKKVNFQTLKNQLTSLTNDFNARETIKKEFVKSYEEMAIANWYFINGIDYIYEAPYEIDVSTEDKRQYMPDFKLKNYPIYHEHYGINKDGSASQFEGNEAEEYIKTLNWKRELHKSNNTDCIETFSYEFSDGSVFKKLERELKNRGVVFHPISNDEITNSLNSIYHNQSFKSFINLIRSFLSLYKASYRDDKAFDQLKRSIFKNNYEKDRACLFISIVEDIYHYYIDYLSNEGKIDFDDMILQSVIALDSINDFFYEYIIVDEFQDISVSRMRLLKRLMQQGNSNLFAVGDDWQAIYRFAGCDLSIFLNFSSYFGDSSIAKITTTHRNSQELQDIIGPFIKENPEQIKKNINSDKHLKNPIQIMYYKEEKSYAFVEVLKEIAKKDKTASILVLGRNNRDLADIELENYVFVDRRNSNEETTIVKYRTFPQMKITFSTVHGSKGLEEDYVILINADDDRFGFPNKMEDDELLNLVLCHKNNYEFAEERRLWYVALTRTRSYAYIIANPERPSIFLEEIKDKCLVINPEVLETSTSGTGLKPLCPKCKTGTLILRNKQFYGCSNYPYCTYTINNPISVSRNKRCPVCGDFLMLKKGPFGEFYGCHNYPRCSYKESQKNNHQNNNNNKYHTWL